MSSNVSTRTRGTENLSGYKSAEAIPEPGIHIPGLNVLLADQDPARAALTKDDLIRRGHQLAGLAHSGQEACHLCQAMRPNLVLLDLDLPQMDGLQSAYVIKRNQRLPVVLMASQIKHKFLDEALKAGVQACLIMPMECSLLEDSLRIAYHQFQRLQAIEERTRELELEINTGKLMGRASGILMQQHGITYRQAVGKLHQKARAQNQPLFEVAQSVIGEKTATGKHP
jgi:AmiR/NasT family two-component response regulator